MKGIKKMKNENSVREFIKKLILVYIFFGLLTAIILISAFRLRAEDSNINSFDLEKDISIAFDLETDIIKVLKNYKQLNEYIYYAPVYIYVGETKYFCLNYKNKKYACEIGILGVKTRLSKEELENKRILLIRVLNLKLKENNSSYKIEGCTVSKSKNMFNCYFEER